MNTKMKFGRRAVLAVALVSSFLSAQSAKAALLNVDQDLDPDILNDGLTYDYNGALLNVLSANVTNPAANTFTLNGDNPQFAGGVQLSVGIDPLGSLGGGTIEISANPSVTSDGNLFVGVLLAGTVDEFGFDSGLGAMDFRWTATGGTAVNEFGGVGASFASILSGLSLPPPSGNLWTFPFSGDGAQMDTFTEKSDRVPDASASVALMIVGFAGCVAFGSRRAAV